MDPSVLDLSTIAPERERARLRTKENPEGLRPDGEEYEILSPAELSLVQIHEIEKEQVAISKMWDKQPVQAEAALNRLVGMLILEAPADDIAALPLVSKVGVMRGFSTATATSFAVTTPEANGKAPED